MVDLQVLTSLDQVLLYCNYYLTFLQSKEEVNCTEPSTSVSFPWPIPWRSLAVTDEDDLVGWNETG
jgi:hypothetical protein